MASSLRRTASGQQSRPSMGVFTVVSGVPAEADEMVEPDEPVPPPPRAKMRARRSSLVSAEDAARSSSQENASTICDRTVWVGGLPTSIASVDALAKSFSQRFCEDVVVGTVRRKEPGDKHAGAGRGSWGFVTFSSVELAKACAEAGPSLELPVDGPDGPAVVLVERARPVEELDDPKTDRLAAAWIEHRTVVRARTAGPQPSAMLHISQTTPRRCEIPSRHTTVQAPPALVKRAGVRLTAASCAADGYDDLLADYSDDVAKSSSRSAMAQHGIVANEPRAEPESPIFEQHGPEPEPEKVPSAPVPPRKMKKPARRKSATEGVAA